MAAEEEVIYTPGFRQNFPSQPCLGQWAHGYEGWLMGEGGLVEE